MMLKIMGVEPLESFRLRVTFEDNGQDFSADTLYAKGESV